MQSKLRFIREWLAGLFVDFDIAYISGLRVLVPVHCFLGAAEHHRKAFYEHTQYYLGTDWLPDLAWFYCTLKALKMKHFLKNILEQRTVLCLPLYDYRD